MAGTSQVSVGTAPTLLVSAPPLGGPTTGPVGWFSLSNGTAATVYLGGGTQVSSSSGYAMGTSPTTNPSGVISGYLFASDTIYGVTASGTSTVTIIQTGA